MTGESIKFLFHKFTFFFYSHEGTCIGAPRIWNDIPLIIYGMLRVEEP
jgi:hypothetical protein